MEDWMSGLNQRFTKPSSFNRDREFESHILRKYKNGLDFMSCYFCLRRRAGQLFGLRVRFERRSIILSVDKMSESVTRPEFCDGKILSRGRNM